MTRGIGLRSGRLFQGTCAAMSWVIALVSLLGAGCRGDCAGDRLPVRGRLVDAESGGAVTGAIVGGRSFTDGAETAIVPLDAPVSDADGSFVLSFGMTIVPCRPPPLFPRPDQLEIVILRDGCEQTVTIEINEDSAQFVDGEFSINELVLTDPILVPPCNQAP